MKLLKALIKQQSKYTRNQVLSWLLWLRNHCAMLSCNYCEYCTVPGGGGCAVTDTYKDIVTTDIKFPNMWGLPRKLLAPQRPPSLEFLRDLYWSKKGNPVPPVRRKQ